MTGDAPRDPRLASKGDPRSPVRTISVLAPVLRNRIDTGWRSEIGVVHPRKGARDRSNREKIEAVGSGPSTCRRQLAPGSRAVSGEIVSAVAPNSGGRALARRRPMTRPSVAAPDFPSRDHERLP